MPLVTDQTPIPENAWKAAELASAESRAAATPMMEQYIEIKAANPDSLLFYRMGDFYELFFEDAVMASRSLGITLTKRGKHLGRDIAMCGVPVHAADDYLQKLIALGYRVAVCEQVEDPAEARKRGSKSVVRRDVVRLVTPGTLTEDKLLSPSEPNYLMALARLRGEGVFGLAWIDISTGTFRLAESTADRLLADILRVDPREVVVAEPVFHDPSLRALFDTLGRVAVPQPAVLFDSATAAGRVAALLRRRHARRLRRLQPRRARRRLGRHRLCREDAALRAPAARAPRTGSRRNHALHRPGDEEQPGALADPVGPAAGQPAERDRPDGDGRRRAASGGAPDVAADRPGSDPLAPRFGGMVPLGFGARRAPAATN